MYPEATIEKIVQRIKINAPQLTTSAETLQVFAEDAYTEAISDGFTDPKAIIAASWLATHFAYLAENAGQTAVSKEKAGDLEKDYFDRTGVSEYLSNYTRMKNAIFGGSGATVSFY